MIIEEIRAVIEAKSSALVHRAEADIAALIHPDFLYVTAGGKTLSKADYIDVAIKGRFRYLGQQVRELDVRLHGTIALASMVQDDHYTIEGREIREAFYAFNAFSYIDGRWLWAGGQTMLPRIP